MKLLRFIFFITTLASTGCGIYDNDPKSKSTGKRSGAQHYSADCVCQQRSNGYINAHFFNKPFGAGNLVNKKVKISIPSVCKSLSACGDGFIELSGGYTTIKVERINSNGAYVYSYSLSGFPE
ncbi:hypothetical protein [Vibrio diabolicus]|uniref:hypothetical protein n=1 Tax=Vibrio diabolicus TaxID=50719 RepID=UPI0029402537|nr:hypothetical protein [Vibrio diabolicus]MDV5062128.1 hypothetical protein [Vibrio diabolicus]